MNLKRIKTFMLVVDQKSFSSVADLLGVSQPAVSKQIKALEEDLKVTLLDRETFTITHAGKLVYEQGKELLEAWERLVQQCSALQGELTGLLQIGASTIPGSYLVPEMIKRFKQLFPHVELRLYVHESAEILECIEQGKLDIGIVGTMPSSPLMVSHLIAQDELLLIGPPDSEPIHVPAGIKELPFICRSERSGTWQAAKQGLKEWAGILTEDLTCVAKVDNTESVISMVESGLGYSIVSNLAGELATTQQRVKKIATLPVKRNFYLTYLKVKEQHPIIQEFMRLCLV